MYNPNPNFHKNKKNFQSKAMEGAIADALRTKRGTKIVEIKGVKCEVNI